MTSPQPPRRPDPSTAWLVVIDPQRIFADPDSPWCAPHFDRIVEPVDALVRVFTKRTVVSRWLPPQSHEGSWADYFRRWSFADRDPDDDLFGLVGDAAPWSRTSGSPTLDVATFGKWGPGLRARTGDHPHLVLTGVATDCCVISTALAAADAGAWVSVVSDACAGSDDHNHEAALTVMGLYAPQIRVLTTEELLAG